MTLHLLPYTLQVQLKQLHTKYNNKENNKEKELAHNTYSNKWSLGH